MEPSMTEILRSRHQLLDGVQVVFIITDVHGKILYASRYTERLFGYPRAEVEGQRIRLLFLEEDQIYFLPNILYLTQYKEGFEGEVLLKQTDGTRVFIHLTTASFKEEGELFFSFFFQEIQRLKRLERERLEMERWASLGMMVEEIAHQVRNPVVSIGGYAHRLQKTLPSSPKQRFYLDQIVRETKRLQTMVQRMEEYVLIPRPVFQREKIQEVVKGVLEDFSGEAAKKWISIDLESGPLGGNGYLFIDRELVTRALSHLMENSLEAIPSGSKGRHKTAMTVVLFEDGENVGVSISDKGDGISKKNLDRIFDPFFSTHPDRVGLGLTFVKRVMEEHAGKIQVESRKRRGTTVTLSFPKDRRRRIRRELMAPEAGLRREPPSFS
jgi:PAS domain S-box-containing protein